jgi:hypothetical protein
MIPVRRRVIHPSYKKWAGSGRRLVGNVEEIIACLPNLPAPEIHEARLFTTSQLDLPLFLLF